MAVFNGERYLEEQLRSIAAQELLPDELVIGDDGSTDGTEEIIRRLSGTFPFPVRYRKNSTRLGFAENFRQTADRAEGDILFFCDQDDIWMKKKTACMAGLLDLHPEILALNASFWVVDEKLRLKRSLEHFPQEKLRAVSLQEFLRHPKYPGMSMAFRRELWEEVSSLKWPEGAAHDFMVNACAAQKHGLYKCGDRLVFYRQHAGNTMGTAGGHAGRRAAEKRISLLKSMCAGIRALPAMDSRQQQYAAGQILVLDQRIRLLEADDLPGLLFYDLAHLKYLPVRAACGDMVCVLKTMRRTG